MLPDPPADPPQPKRRRGNSKLTTTPSSPVSSPVSPPRPATKRPRRGSKLNLNIGAGCVAPILAIGSSLPEDDASSASADDGSDIALPREKKNIKSKATLSKERNNAAVVSGSFKVHSKRWDAWVQKLQQLDKNVEVFEGNPKRIRDVRCSSCARVIKQSEPYNISRFKQHIARCKHKGSKLHVQSISGMFTLRLDHSSAPKPTPKPVTLVVRPCSGITGKHDARIPQYTSRTEVRYAGGRSRASLAIEHFGRTFLLLSKEQKDEVDLHYRTSCQWELDHDDGRVFSRVCLETVECKSDAQGLQACSECLHILALHSFQVSISRTGTSDERRKYIPFRNQSVVTGKMFATNQGLGRFVQEVCSPCPCLCWTSSLNIEHRLSSESTICYSISPSHCLLARSTTIPHSSSC